MNQLTKIKLALDLNDRVNYEHMDAKSLHGCEDIKRRQTLGFTEHLRVKGKKAMINTEEAASEAV